MKTLITIVATIVLFTACNSCGIDTKFMADGAIRVDDQPGECPYLTKDNKGNTVLSWVRIINDSTTEFRYATSK